MPLTAGTLVGPYEIVGWLGAGAMSACGRGERAARVEPPRVGVGRLRLAGRPSYGELGRSIAEARPHTH
jgi:hypothetical protein